MDYTIFTQYNFNLSLQEQEKFKKFLHLFKEYNSHTNLSAIRDDSGIIEKHFVDSLYGAMILSELQKEEGKLLDIWSGWWFPGIPLKIVLPNLDVTLLDSIGKKTRAQQFFIENLWLENIFAIQDRAENLAKNSNFAKQFDIIVSRATAYIDDILTWAKPFLKKWWKILLYKMPSDEEKKSRQKIMKKLNLQLEGEFEYFLWGKERVIYIFSEK